MLLIIRVNARDELRTGPSIDQFTALPAGSLDCDRQLDPDGILVAASTWLPAVRRDWKIELHRRCDGLEKRSGPRSAG